jgi:CubicO group peptidase (beta-lactamase class C family)
MTLNTTTLRPLLEAKIDKLLAQHQVPGLAVGVVIGSEQVIICRGVTSIFQPLPITPDTLFQIGSTTKTITATIIMRLVERGRLDLDAPVKTYLPELSLSDADVAAKVTLRHCLTHTGGWVGDYFVRQGEGDDALARYVASLHTVPQLTPLGTVWHYNNAGFGILGRIIEVITGQNYQNAAQVEFLEPLAMLDSHFDIEQAIVKRFTVGHYLDEAGVLCLSQPWGFGRAIDAIGGLKSSVEDQLRYARFCLGDGAPLLSQASQQQMYRPQVKASLGGQMGLSWFCSDYLDSDGQPVQILSHGGATNGQLSAFWFITKLQLGFTALTNSDKGALVYGALSQWLRSEVLGLSLPADLPDDSLLEQYCGRYVGAAFGTVVEISLQEGQLLRRITPGDASSVTSTPAPAPAPALGHLIVPETMLLVDTELKGGKIEFLRDEQGNIAWLRLNSRIYKKEE